jgi:hypothetical protein
MGLGGTAGAGTDEEILIEILATRSNAEINAIKTAYAALFKRDLEKDVVSETGGRFRRLLVGLVQVGGIESQYLSSFREPIRHRVLAVRPLLMLPRLPQAYGWMPIHSIRALTNLFLYAGCCAEGSWRGQVGHRRV